MDILLTKKSSIFKVNPKIKADIAKYYREEYKRILADPDHILISYQ